MRNKPIICLISILILVSSSQTISASEIISVMNSQPVVGSVETVPNIWKGNVPTKVGYPIGTYSQKLEFPIQGLLPYSTLSDRATGVEVEFEIWSQSGRKVGYDTVYTFDWNPVGPNTLVSMYLYESEAIGNHTLLIRTIYELSTTGLLTRYLKSEVKIPIEIFSFSKPAYIDSMTTNWGSETITYSFASSDSKSPVDFYEVGFQYLIGASSDKSKYANYSEMFVIKNTKNSNFDLAYEDIVNWVKSKRLDVEKSTIMVRVRGVNSWGVGDWGYGLYTDTSNFNRYYLNVIAARNKADAEAKAKADAEAKARAEAEAKAKRPARVLDLRGIQASMGMEYQFSSDNQVNPISGFEVGISYFNSPGGDPSVPFNYSSPLIIKKIQNPEFFLSKDEIEKYLKSAGEDPTKSIFLVQVRAVNEFGIGEWSSGLYTESSKFFPAAMKRSIKCIKGNVVRKISAVNPKCPKGFKKG